MLLHPTLEKLTTMRFSGMAEALERQLQMDGLDDMGFEERLGLLLDHEQAVRETRRMKTRLRKDKVRQNGSIEDVDFRHPRGLDKSLVLRLADCQWIKDHNNCKRLSNRFYRIVQECVHLPPDNHNLRRST